MTGPRSRDRAHAGGRPFWAHACIDSGTLGQVTLLAYALAQQWAVEDTAQRFSRASHAAAAVMVRSGAATLDLWEAPDELICRVARGTIVASPRPPGADPSHAREHRGPSATTSPSGIAVERSDDAVTIRLAV
jgi:hypothetical protein